MSRVIDSMYTVFPAGDDKLSTSTLFNIPLSPSNLLRKAYNTLLGEAKNVRIYYSSLQLTFTFKTHTKNLKFEQSVGAHRKKYTQLQKNERFTIR